MANDINVTFSPEALEVLKNTLNAKSPTAEEFELFCRLAWDERAKLFCRLDWDERIKLFCKLDWDNRMALFRELSWNERMALFCNLDWYECMKLFLKLSWDDRKSLLCLCTPKFLEKFIKEMDYPTQLEIKKRLLEEKILEE